MIGREICILVVDWSIFFRKPRPLPYLESAAVRRPFGTRGVDRWKPLDRGCGGSNWHLSGRSEDVRCAA